MTSGLLNSLKHLFVPHGFLFLLILIGRFKALPQALWPYAAYYPPVLFGIAAALCWRFHKDRYVFIIAWMALSERAAYFLFTGADGALRTDATGYAAMAILLPANLVFFELVGDRGVLTFRGILQWLLIVAETVLLAMILTDPEIAARAEEIRATLDHLASGAYPGWNPVKIAFGAALLILSIRFLVRRVSLESGSLWVLGLLYLGISDGIAANAVYYLTFASLIYTCAILETSYSLAFQDELTGLPGRRALNDRLTRLSSKYAIAMADIDHFKKFNDTYGHDIGDQVLKMVAAKLADVSGGGKVFRYGGEEFAIVFSGGSVERAKPCLEALCRQIEAKPFTLRGFGRAFRKRKPEKTASPKRKTVRITVSIGVAEKGDRHPDPQAVLKAADTALYRAKRAGRNRVAA